MIFDGQEFAREKQERLKIRVNEIQKQGIVPKLVSILADKTPETALYVSLKSKFAGKIGVDYEVNRFAGTDTKEIIEFIKKQNQNPAVHGIMVQLPVINESEIVQAIAPEKDVDCLTEENLGLIMIGRPKFLPASVRAVIEIMKYALTRSGVDVEREPFWLTGKNVCIIGASIIVGKPLAVFLSDQGATVTVCRSRTENLAEFTRKADILVSATGAVDLVKKEIVKEGAIVIDVGISKLLRGGKFRIVGDVNEDVLAKTSFLTPVPGGVGPVTVACLFENLLQRFLI